jgi:hypothetical protein
MDTSFDKVKKQSGKIAESKKNLNKFTVKCKQGLVVMKTDEKYEGIRAMFVVYRVFFYGFNLLTIRVVGVRNESIFARLLSHGANPFPLPHASAWTGNQPHSEKTDLK